MSPSISVLVVDDHNLFRTGIRVSIQRDHAISISGEAINGEDAVQKAASLNPDVILMDINMPLMDGIESTKLIKEKNKNTKVIMLSSHDTEDVVRSSLSAGASGYCLKDINSESLCSAIKAVQKGDVWLDPALSKVMQVSTRTQTTNCLYSACPTKIGPLSDPSEGFHKIAGTGFNEKFENLGQLGQGGMSLVYKARHKLIDKIVAIKVLARHLNKLETFAERFNQEARITSQLSHPNIISVYDFGFTDDSEAFLAMEYADGPSLADVLQRIGRMEERECLSIFKQLIDALCHAHSKDIVHRDIKPANVILVKDSDGKTTVKLVDFGLAKLMSEKRFPSLTQNGQVIGSPVYMSPEQCQGLELDHRSDIYSLGCLIYEAICGFPPFRGSSTMDTLRMHVQDDFVDPPADLCSEQMRSILRKCLQKHPEDRYSSACEIELPVASP